MSRMLLIVGLLLAGFWCLAHQERPAHAQWLLGVGKTPVSAANNTALDGHTNSSATCPLVLSPITTTAAGEVVAFVEINASPRRNNCGGLLARRLHARHRSSCVGCVVLNRLDMAALVADQFRESA